MLISLYLLLYVNTKNIQRSIDINIKSLYILVGIEEIQWIEDIQSPYIEIKISAP